MFCKPVPIAIFVKFTKSGMDKYTADAVNYRKNVAKGGVIYYLLSGLIQKGA